MALGRCRYGGLFFTKIESDVDRGNVRLENLVKYLESIQSIFRSRRASQESIRRRKICHPVRSCTSNIAPPAMGMI